MHRHHRFLICVGLVLFIVTNAGCDGPNQGKNSVVEQQSSHGRLPIEGRWRDGEFDLVIAEGRLTTLINGEPYEYPNGEVTFSEPGVALLNIEGGSTETFRYEWDGKRLAMGFQRGGAVYCDPVDEAARMSAKQLNSNKAKMTPLRKSAD